MKFGAGKGNLFLTAFQKGKTKSEKCDKITFTLQRNGSLPT